MSVDLSATNVLVHRRSVSCGAGQPTVMPSSANQCPPRDANYVTGVFVDPCNWQPDVNLLCQVPLVHVTKPYLGTGST